MRDTPPTPLFSWANRIEAIRAEATRRRRWRVALAAIGGCGAIAVPLLLPHAPRLIWNATPSSPTGLYAVTVGIDARRGDTVIAWLPEPARALADTRHYVPRTVPVVKTVAAVRGDRLCSNGEAVSVNGIVAARRLRADRRGRGLPSLLGCRALGIDEVLLLGTAPDSFDGRYFGPTSRSLLIGTARLIWAR